MTIVLETAPASGVDTVSTFLRELFLSELDNPVYVGRRTAAVQSWTAKAHKLGIWVGT